MVIKKSVAQIVINILCIPGLAFLCLALAELGVIETSYYVLMLTFIVCFISLCRRFSTNIWAICFMIAFMTFLLGTISVNLIFDHEVGLDFSDSTLIHIVRVLEISVVSFYYAYICFNRKKVSLDYSRFGQNEELLVSLRRASKLVYFVTIPFQIIINLEKAVFVHYNTYTSYYTEYTSNLPSIVDNVAKMSEVAFFFFLATFPKKKEAIRILAINLAVSMLSLGYGQRNGLVLMLLVTIGYMFWRNKVCPNEEKWITKKVVFALVLLLPFFVSIMYAFNAYRSGDAPDVAGVFNQFFAFFEQQGGSVDVIGYGYVFKERFNPNINYSLSQITKVFTDNRIIASIFDIEVYSGQTVEAALNGNNFGATLTYLVMPHNYLEGVGMGTSYIAELFHDFGYIGVIIINALYGYIFAKGTKYLIKNPYTGALFFFTFKNIIYAPRYQAFYFFTASFTVTVLISVLLIWLIRRLLVPAKKG